ncbi:MAG TPA: Flp pilus assembly protein CpaB [Gemmatimonadaceae bacterium]|nr:Flp pilus assembly protein CpaB [Gemmatimonadaceae bacterium]
MAERRFTLVFYVAIVTALAATYGVYRVLQNAKAESQVATRPVIVAARDMPEGAAIDRLALAVKEWPVQTIPEGAFSAPDSLVGRVTRVAVFAGEPIVPGRLAPAGTGPGLEVKIAPGKRAMAVRINDVAGISGLIQPNSRVDVLVTLPDEGANNRQVAKLFMENMRVLSVGTQVQRGEDGKPIEATTATLEVFPEEAERLAVAMHQGTIQLVLRGYGDPDSVNTRGARSSDVLAQLRGAPEVRRQEPVDGAPRRATRPAPRRPAPAPVAPPVVSQAPRQPDSLVVQVYRGAKVSTQKVEKSDSARTDTSKTGQP